MTRSRRARLVGAFLAAVLAALPASAHADRVVLSTGHVDAVAPTLEDGVLSVRVKDDTGSEPVLRQPYEVLFHVKPQAHMTVPEGLPESFAFLGAPGSDVWLLPQVQDPELLWAGWSSETIPPGTVEGDELRWVLNRVTGPGPVQLYDTGTFGAPRVFFDSADGVPDTDVRAVGSHAHFNWVFHAPGVYTLDFGVEASRGDGTHTVAYASYRFFVGDLADLPPELVYVDGIEPEYDPGETVELTAVQVPESRFAAYRWLRRCAGDAEPVEVATGSTYRFAAVRELDACRLAVALLDDEGRELLRSDERLLTIRSGSWGPRRIISYGHVDVLDVALADGALRVALKDDSGEETVIRQPDEVLLHAKPQSAFTITEDLPPEYGFLGKLGDTVWLLPEVQQEDLLWPGWESCGVPYDALTGNEMTWRLLSVEGPGALQLFTTDVFGGPQLIFDSADGLPDASTMAASTHVHANWTFSQPGLYKLRFDLSGRLADGGAEVASGPVEYWFHVGDLADLPEYPAPGEDPTPTPTPTVEPITTPAAIAPTPTPTPTATPTPPATRPAAIKPTLRLTSASVRGRVLTLRTRLNARSRVSITVRRGTRTVAKAKARTVSASTRTLRVRLSRRLRAGRYSVRVTAQANGARVTRTVGLRVR